MNQHGGFPTLLDLCTPLRPVGSDRNGNDRSIADQDVDGAPIYRRASSTMEPPPRGFSVTNMKLSGSPHSMSAAVAASPPSRRSTVHVTTSPHGSYALSAEPEQSPDAGSVERHAVDGVTMSSAPFNLLKRRGTLPFLGHGPRDAADNHTTTTTTALQCSAMQPAPADGTVLPRSTELEGGAPLPHGSADSTSEAAGPLLPTERRGSRGAHELSSLSDNAWPSLPFSASHGSQAAPAPDGVVPGTGNILSAEQYFASLGSQWQPGMGFGEVAAAAATAQGAKGVSQSWETTSVDGCRQRNSATQMLSSTIPQYVAHLVPSRHGSSTSTASASMPLLPQRLSLATPGRGSSATTVPLAASINAPLGEDVCSSEDEHLEHGGSSFASHSHRDPMRCSEDRSALDASTNAAGTTLPAVAELMSAGPAAGPPPPPPSQRATWMPTADVILVVPLGRVPPHAVPLPDHATDEHLDSAAELDASHSTQLPASATGLLGSRDGHSAAAGVAVDWAPQDDADSGTSAVLDEALLRRQTGSATSLALADTVREGEANSGHFTSLPVSQHAGSHSFAIAASPPLLSSCSHIGSPSSPPLVRSQRRGTLAAPTELLLHPSLLPEDPAMAVPIAAQDTSCSSASDGCNEDATSDSAAMAALVGRRSPDSRDSLSLNVSDSGSRVGPAAPHSAWALKEALFPEPITVPSSTAAAAAVKVPQSHLGKLVGWVNRKCRDVVQHNGQNSNAYPASTTATPRGRVIESLPNADAWSCTDSLTEVTPPAGRGMFGLPPLALTLSFGAVAASGEAESRPSTPRQAPGNGSWFAAGSRADHRSGVRGTSGLLQLRRPAKSQLPAASSPPSSPWEGSTSTPPLPDMSFSQRSTSGLFDAMSGSQISSESALLRLSRSVSGGGGGALNGSVSLTGDQRNLSLPSSPARRSQLSASHGSATADDHYRELLYHLFHHPPSSRMGDLTECCAAYMAMAETSSNGHHVLNWGELGLLLRPEDYIDYRSLYPLYHFVSFDDFVEFVEVLSVRHRQ